jgi:cyclopropane-fatty-acyl-phospholipid synthase
MSFRLAALVRRLPRTELVAGQFRKAQLSGEVHSKQRDHGAISYHYDLPPEFFALWLDQRMIYSSAHFNNQEETDLDAAQYRKLDYLCKKLRLQANEILLDIGCGWGGLLVFAVHNYGVKGLGITLSVSQAEIARQRIRDSGLNDRCRVELCDYRDLSIGRQFDKIVGVGMFEHVGENSCPRISARSGDC